jgi:hypothetical protein
MRKLLLSSACLGIALAGLGGSYIVPLDNDAIQYKAGAVAAAVSRLQARIDKGEAKLKYEDEYGYLRSVLKELGVPVSFQVLVFSKTSFQAPRIRPRMPRALYFSDDMAVGFVRTGDVLELAALDPKQGIIFYTLDPPWIRVLPPIRSSIDAISACSVISQVPRWAFQGGWFAPLRQIARACR